MAAMVSLACGGGAESTDALGVLRDPPPGDFERIPPEPGELDPFAQNARLGRGMNIGDALEAPVEGQWGVRLQYRYFELLQETGFDSLRLPIRWSSHAAETAPYTIQPEFMARIEWAVGHALARDMPVIINVHHYDEIQEDPAGHSARLAALWRQIGEHFADYPAGLYFEVLNEPKLDPMTDAAWNAVLAESLAAIRESNPGRTVLVGGTEWNKWYTLDEVVWPEDDQNLIATFHYYEPFSFTHQGWSGGGPEGTTWGTEAEYTRLETDFAEAAAWSASANRPLHVGEFGVRNVAAIADRAAWTAAVVDQCAEHGMSFAYWDLVSNFNAYDDVKGAWIPELRAALVE